MAAVEETPVAAHAPNGSEAVIKLDTAGTGAAPDRTAPQASAIANARAPTQQEIGFAVTFTRIVSVLSRSPHYKHYTLSDLEWLVVPAIMTGQCAVLQAKVNGTQTPLAVVLWASVSEEVDKRLSANMAMPLKLRPDEWRSGSILWLIDAVGDLLPIQYLLRHLQEGPLKGRAAKARTLGPNAYPTLRKLDFGTCR